MKRDITLLSIIGGAGHGKGTFKEIYLDNLSDDFKVVPVTYSNTMKRQLSMSFITDELRNNYKSVGNDLDILNYLKDSCPEVMVFKDLNMRDVLQTIGTDFYREIDPDIHIRFEYSKMLKELIKEKNKKVMFISDDTRFPNELNNALKLNTVDNKKDIQDYIKFFLNKTDNLPTEASMKLKMVELFDLKNSSKKEISIISKFVKTAMTDINDLKKSYIAKKDWSEIEVPQTGGKSVLDGYSAGVVNIFRGIVDPEINYTKDLDSDINKYSRLSFIEIKKIKNQYDKSGVDWNLENIKKYGYARSNFMHYSEKALNDSKPLAIVSKPMTSKRTKKTYIEQVKNLMRGQGWVDTIHATNNTLRIVFSAGSLFDTKEAETIFQEKGLREYKSFLQKMEDNEDVFSPGPALGLYLAFRKLNEAVPDEMLNIEFGLITKIPATFPAFWDTYEHWITEGENPLYEFDFMSFGQENTAQAHLGACADLAFVTSQSTAEDLYEVKIPAIYIPNISKENNLELYAKRNGGIMLASDFDGVIGDTKSERAYQKAKIDGHDDPVLSFSNYESERAYLPMDLGPMGKVIKKLNVLVKENQNHKLETNSQEIKYPFEFTVVTARGGRARKRFMNTMKEHNIAIEDFHMMSGLNKNNPLKIIELNKKDVNILFIDDGEMHFKRSKDLNKVISGYIVNDYNYELTQKNKSENKNKVNKRGI
jgi:hypothetical protein